MELKEKSEKRTHHGHTVKRFRQTLGIKQDALAADMGLSQQTISSYEQKQVIEDEMLAKFAKALNISVDLIKETEEDPITVIIENNTFEKSNPVIAAHVDVEELNNIYNPIDRIIELSNEKTALYERMLTVEKEKVALLEELLKAKK